MSQEIQNVVVVGATGHLGPTVLNALVASKEFTVSALTRGSSKFSFPAGVKVIKTDYTEASLLAGLLGQDAIVSTIAGAAVGEQKKVIDAAIKAGVKRFLPSEFGSNTKNKKGQELVPIFKNKVQIVDYLKTKKISWTVVATGPIIDRALQVNDLGFALSTRRAHILEPGSRRFSATTLSTLGQSVVSILLHPAQTANKYIYVSSFAVSQNDILAAVQKYDKGGEWKVERGASYEEAVKRRQSLQGGERGIIRKLVTAATLAEGTGSHFEVDESVSNALLGLRKETLDEVVRAALK